MSQNRSRTVYFQILPEPERVLAAWLAAQGKGERSENTYWFVTACEPARFRSLPAWFREQLDAFTPHSRTSN